MCIFSFVHLKSWSDRTSNLNALALQVTVLSSKCSALLQSIFKHYLDSGPLRPAGGYEQQQRIRSNNNNNFSRILLILWSGEFEKCLKGTRRYSPANISNTNRSFACFFDTLVRQAMAWLCWFPDFDQIEESL